MGHGPWINAILYKIVRGVGRSFSNFYDAKFFTRTPGLPKNINTHYLPQLIRMSVITYLHNIFRGRHPTWIFRVMLALTVAFLRCETETAEALCVTARKMPRGSFFMEILRGGRLQSTHDDGNPEERKDEIRSVIASNYEHSFSDSLGEFTVSVFGEWCSEITTFGYNDNRPVRISSRDAIWS